MAQLAVAAAGAAVGSLFGAPQVGWLVGSFIGSQLFAEERRVEGPRLGDLQVQASTYGMGIPQVFGSMRLAGNVIWAKPLIEKRRKQSAGKGGGGQTVVSYEYFATFTVAFARGPVDAIRRVWAEGKLLVDLSENAEQGKTYRYGERIYRFHLGTEDQAPDPVVEMHEGAGNAPAYRGLAYITFDELPLKDFGNRIPNITAEVVASASTVHPSQQLDLASQGVDNWGKDQWRLDPERPFIYNAWSGWLLMINRVTGEVVYRVHLESDPAIVAWWQQNGWQGGPGLFGYAVDPVSGDLFIAFNGLSRTTFARLDPDTLQLKSWYRQGFFVPGPMLVYAGRYLACKSALNGPVVIIDFANPIGGPTLAASVDYSSHGTGLAIDPEGARLYVLTESATGAEGWVSWVDAAFEKHGSFHLEDDLGFPAGSASSGLTYDRASGRVIVGASTGLFACHPETLQIEQSLLGTYSGGGFVDAWENQPTVDRELWLPFASTIHRIDTVSLTPIASWSTSSLHGVGLEAAVHDPLTEAVWTSAGGVRKLWFDRKGHGSVTLGGIVSALCGRAGLEPSDLDVSELDQGGPRLHGAAPGDRERLGGLRVQGGRLPQWLRRDLPAHVGKRRSGHRRRQQQPPADRLPGQHLDGARHLDRDPEHGIWHYLEIEAVIDDTSGLVTVWLDGVEVIDLSGVDTKQQTEPGADRVRFQLNGLNQFTTPTIDDVYITDAATRLGESRVAVLYPSADTADADWTPSTGVDHYATVDETTVNSDADYVASGTVGDLDLYEIEDLPFVPDSIHAVQVTMCARKDDAATREARSKVKSGAATANGAPHALTASYVYYRDIFETDPDTSTAWTSGGVDALQIGPEVVT